MSRRVVVIGAALLVTGAATAASFLLINDRDRANDDRMASCSAPVAQQETQLQTAGLLVPRSTRLIIGYKRVALA